MQVILHNYQLARVTNEEDILVKVPEYLYQVFYDQAQTQYSLEQRQAAIFKTLREWVEDAYPGRGIKVFADYSRAEADAIAKKTGYPITWGMWLVLSYHTTTIQVDLSETLYTHRLKH